jgi:hypothetical protein
MFSRVSSTRARRCGRLRRYRALPLVEDVISALSGRVFASTPTHRQPIATETREKVISTLSVAAQRLQHAGFGGGPSTGLWCSPGAPQECVAGRARECAAFRRRWCAYSLVGFLRVGEPAGWVDTGVVRGRPSEGLLAEFDERCARGTAPKGGPFGALTPYRLALPVRSASRFPPHTGRASGPAGRPPRRCRAPELPLAAGVLA